MKMKTSKYELQNDKNENQEENLDIQSTEVSVIAEEENFGIGYEIVISSEKH